MKKLIVNADDFGLDTGVNEGIAHCHEAGIVTAATVLVNLSGFRDAQNRKAALPDLDLGVHLNLTWGNPLVDSRSSTLLKHGRFRTKRSLAFALLLGRVDKEDIRAEFARQLDRFQDAFGVPSHADVHQHFHAFKVVWDVLTELCHERRIPFVRRAWDPDSRGLAMGYISRQFRNRTPSGSLRMTDHFRGLSLPGHLNPAVLRDVLQGLNPGLTELMVHPGKTADRLQVPDRLGSARTVEEEALTAPDLPERLKKMGVELTTFREEDERSSGDAILAASDHD